MNIQLPRPLGNRLHLGHRYKFRIAHDGYWKTYESHSQEAEALCLAAQDDNHTLWVDHYPPHKARKLAYQAFRRFGAIWQPVRERYRQKGRKSLLWGRVVGYQLQSPVQVLEVGVLCYQMLMALPQAGLGQ